MPRPRTRPGSPAVTEAMAAEERERLLEQLRREARPEPLRWRVLLTEAVRTRMRKRLRSGEVKTYEGYRVTIPLDLAKELGLDQDPELIVAVAKPKWYHGIIYEDATLRLFHRLPAYAQAEICQLGHAPQDLCRDYRTITVIASEQELRELGLEPGQPITLKELLERARRLKAQR